MANMFKADKNEDKVAHVELQHNITSEYDGNVKILINGSLKKTINYSVMPQYYKMDFDRILGEVTIDDKISINIQQIEKCYPNTNNPTYKRTQIKFNIQGYKDLSEIIYATAYAYGSGIGMKKINKANLFSGSGYYSNFIYRRFSYNSSAYIDDEHSGHFIFDVIY